MNVELATRWLEEGDYNDATVPQDVDKLIANFIREQAARITELEEVNKALQDKMCQTKGCHWV